jgi:hypothetical protein
LIDWPGRHLSGPLSGPQSCAIQTDRSTVDLAELVRRNDDSPQAEALWSNGEHRLWGAKRYLKGDTMPEAKDEHERPKPAKRVSRPRRRAESGRQSNRDRDRDRGHDHEREREHEEWDDPAEHLEIERRRFAGGLTPTPELYALAREQWYELPGVVVRPSMDPVIGDQASDQAQLPGQAHPNGSDQ